MTTVLHHSCRAVYRSHLSRSTPSLQHLQQNYFSFKRPKSIISLSNPNRKRNRVATTSTDGALTDWSEYDVHLFQYFHDPRSSQMRVLLDYFKIPYLCIEVTPFSKGELSTATVPEGHHNAPLIRMRHRDKLGETVERYKKEAVEYMPKNARSDALKIANPNTFRERVRQSINKYQNKTQEEKDAMKEKVDDLFEHYDSLCHDRYNVYYHHDDVFTSLLPFIESNLSNDQHRRLFNDKCSKEQIEFYSTKFVWILQACTVKSFHSCFQLFAYAKMFRKLREWGKLQVELLHLVGAIRMRIFHRRRYCKRAETGSQPKGHALRHTYEYLQMFTEDLPDLNKKGKIIRPKKEGEELPTVDKTQVEEKLVNTKADIALIGKPFHGGRTPDILDLLVYGALRGTQGLDIHKFLFKRADVIHDWYTKMQDEVGLTSCTKHI